MPLPPRPGAPRMAPSISSGRIRKPRTFIWRSVLPNTTREPSPSSFPWSPVRYIRFPFPCTAKLLAVWSGSWQYPRTTCGPEKQISPTRPGPKMGPKFSAQM